MPRESKTRFAILGMLQIGPRSGYDIKKELERSAGSFWNESYGQIYPMLKRIVEDGFATVETIERPEQVDRKVYTITEAGHKELQRWLKQPAEPVAIRDERILKVYFGAHADAKTPLHHVERIREQTAAEQAQLVGLREQLLNLDDSDPHATFQLLSLRHAELTLKATIAWCDEAEEALSLSKQ